MIGKFLTIAAATAVTTIAVAGALTLVALDLHGMPLLERAWSYLSRPRERSAIEDRLAGTKDLTLFKTVKVAGRPYAVTMGVSFATPEDLATSTQKSRWCYCMIAPKDGGVPRQIELAAQEGSAPPRYHDLTSYPAGELAVLGETVGSLSAIARRHCIFATEPGRPGSVAHRLVTIVLRSHGSERDPS